MKKSHVPGILVLLVFVTFTVSVLLVLLSGADTVQKLTHRDQSTYQQRTTVQYLATRIHQSDLIGAVSVDNSGEISTLVLKEEIDGQIYETRIYCYNGYLREMFCLAGLGLSAEFGEEILPMKNFQAHYDGNYIQIQLHLPDDSHENCIFYLRSNGGLSHEK